LDFDASVIGARVVPMDSASLLGIVATILNVQNGKIRESITVSLGYAFYQAV
jgi:hypothetical protein